MLSCDLDTVKWWLSMGIIVVVPAKDVSKCNAKFMLHGDQKESSGRFFNLGHKSLTRSNTLFV